VGRPWRVRLALGAGFGLGNYVIGLLWVQEFSVPGYIGVVLISSIYSVVALLAVPTGRRRLVAIGFPAAMVLSDWARDRFPVGGLPLGGVALGQAAGPLAPVLRLGGSLALVGLTALLGVTLAEVMRTGWNWWRAAERSPKVLGQAAGLVAVTVLLPVLGTFSPSGAGGHLPALRVGLVQGGGPRGTRAIATDPQVVFDRHEAASTQLAGPLDLIVWPEGVLQSHTDYTKTANAAFLQQLATNFGATVVSGVEQDVGTSHYLNQVVAWDPSGIEGVYVKNHLVPFGEYVPYRSFFQRYFNLADVPYDGIPGHGPGILRTPAAPLAVMISYEVFFDERARGGVRAGGQILVVPTNTASYRSTQVPTQEVAADKLRAWETGRWLVQVTPTGYSTVVSPTGAVLRKTRLGAQQVIEATVPRRTGMTVYDHLGDGPVALAAMVMWALSAGLGLARARRRPPA
ncbi:MAG TPA: apolipoprotein N-acyltransferase, partial [Acidimicrobiales bacterium]|nr:apolipoprotein N-acyltransferase [Acidimicrobiales bacterium]